MSVIRGVKLVENEYQKLARKSLEYVVTTGEKLPVPNGLKCELTSKRAGVFVTLHLRGKLRGCIGTITPTTESVAKEIIQNAIAAGLNDVRFTPVTKAELGLLSYKVDVLETPERITGSSDLDVKKYGVIITAGHKRGILLPNSDGIKTVEEQLKAAFKKASIHPTESYVIERFAVVRHG